MSEVLLHREASVAHITLNRPQAGNALDQAMADALLDAVLSVAYDPAVRVVTLTGQGRMFCVGGDLADFATHSDDIGAYLAKLAGTLHQAMAQFAAMKKPLVTLVNGPAAGAGLSLAIAGDFVLAHPDAHFTAAYGGIGLTPDGGMSWMLPRLVGLRRAQDILLSNRRVSAEEAQEIGMITRLSESLVDDGRSLTQTLSTGAVGAMGQARCLLLGGLNEGLAAQMDHELQSITAAGESAEGREGVGAFLARRKPNYMKGNENG